MATPGFLRLAFIASMVTSTIAASIWLLIIAAMLGGPPISRIVSGSMFCSLKNPRSIATKYGSEDAVGNTPTFTLSCATAAWPEPAITAATRTTIAPSVFNPSFGIVTPPSISGSCARDGAAPVPLTSERESSTRERGPPYSNGARRASKSGRLAGNPSSSRKRLAKKMDPRVTPENG